MSMLKELRRHPSAVAGLVILVIFVGFSIYTVFAFPYSEAIKLWRAGPGVWDELPRRAAPVWYDYFTRKKLPRTIIVSLEDGGTMTAEPAGDGKNRVEIVFPFEYAYDGFPKEISLFVEANIAARGESYSVYMRKPNGETVTLTEDINFIQSQAYRISQEGGLRMKLGGLAPHVGLFVEDPHRKPDQPLKGRYELVMRGDLSEEAELSVAKLVVYGQVHGLAGTDHLRRDLTVALSWGAPIALMFGVLAAVGTQISTFILGGIGTWFGGRLDAIFQRVTEVFMILPLLAVLIMIGHFYSRSIWVMLGMVILLNVFSSPLKVYGQCSSRLHIEAARDTGPETSALFSAISCRA